MGSQRRLLEAGGDSGLEGGPNNMEGAINNNTNKSNGVNSPNPFARRGLLRSPLQQTQEVEKKQRVMQNQHDLQVEDQKQCESRMLQQGEQAVQLQQLPTHSRWTLPSQQPKVEAAKSWVEELHNFVDKKHNVHKDIKELVTKIQKTLGLAIKEWNGMVQRAEKAESELAAAKTALATAALHQPIFTKTRKGKSVGAENTSDSATPKRPRSSPGDERPGRLKKLTQEDTSLKVKDVKENRNEEGWRTVGSQKEKRKQKKLVDDKEKKSKKKDKRRPQQEKHKGDALLVKANDVSTYTVLLKKLREDPELKELGEQVVKTRRTQKGEMLFELKKDPSVRSSAYQQLIAKSLGEQAEVRALSQETVIECRDLDEITTEEELRHALKKEFDLGVVAMTIRIRKSYGGTQRATIRLAVAAANKLLEKGKVKVGWSVCSMRVIPPIKKQAERCFKCLGFGHYAGVCKGPDRSELCRKCGEKGHVARDCTQQARCMLCKSEDGNGHATGGYNCPVYKKAMACHQ